MKQTLSVDDGLVAKKTGRPRGFDEEQAVQTAMRLFWRHGYEGVGMNELTRAIGVAPPSLYGVFGSKANLYRRALDRYAQEFKLIDPAAVDQAASLAEAVRSLLNSAIDTVTSSRGERSCMVSSGMLCAHPDHDALATELAHRRNAIRHDIATLLSAWLEPPRCEAVARHLAAVLLGFSIQARDGASRDELRAVADDISRSFEASAPGHSVRQA